MLLRKSRKHLHGNSNKSLSSFNFNSTFNQKFIQKTIPVQPKKQIFSSCLKKRLIIKQKHKKTQSQLQTYNQNKDLSNETLSKLKNMYHDRKNIVRIVDQWGFDSKGYITKQHFKRYLTTKIKQDVDQNQLENIFKESDVKNDFINVKDLLSIIYGKTQGVMLNQNLFDPKEFLSTRNQKVQNLKQSLKHYHKTQKSELNQQYLNQLVSKINYSLKKFKQVSDKSLFNCSKQQIFKEIKKWNNFSSFDIQNIKKIENQINFNEMKYLLQCNRQFDGLLLDPILRRTNKSHIKNDDNKEEFPKNDEKDSKIMMKSMSNFNFFKQDQKILDFDPKSMTFVNQQKTRFGNSKFTKSSQNFYPSEFHQNFNYNQKEFVCQTLKSQQNLHKQRYQNKLQRLRNYIKIQKQNIDKKDVTAEQKDKKRLERIKQQQQAYNYVNFIKKKWQ